MSISHDLFCTEIEGLLDTWGPNEIALERFQPRPGLVSKSAETISAMIGSVLTITRKDYDVKPMIFPASEWKNAVKRSGLVLDDLYALGAKSGYAPHTIDSIGIGMYCGGPAKFQSVAYLALLKRLFKNGAPPLQS